jgi:hypothetical protein
MVLRQPLTQRGGHQQQLLTITLDEVLSHTQKLLNSALLDSLILSGWVVEGELVEFDGLGAGLAAAGPALEDRL